MKKTAGSRVDASACKDIVRNAEHGIIACSRIIASSTNPQTLFFATFHRAQGYSVKGDRDSALRDFDDAVRMNDVLRLNTSGRLYQARASALANKGEFDRAISDYDEAIKEAPKAIRIDPRLANAYFSRATAFKKQGALDRAIRDLDEAIRINARYAQAYNLRGELYLANGQVDRAIRDFNEAIFVDRHFTEAYVNRGGAYFKQEDYDRAIRDYNDAIRLAPKSATAYLGRAAAYEQNGDVLRAQRDYAEARRLDATIASIGRFGVHLRTDDFLTGVLREKVVPRNLAAPNVYEAVLVAANLLRERGQFNECIEVLTPAIQNPGVIEASHYKIYYARALCFEESKQFDKAEIDFKKALDLAPEEPHVLGHLGLVMVERGVQRAEGLTLINRAVELKPDDGQIVDLLGWAHYKLNKFEESVRYLRRAAELSPDIVTVHDHLGDAFWRLNRKADAYRSWEHARSLTPHKAEMIKLEEKIRHGLPPTPEKLLTRPAPIPMAMQPVTPPQDAALPPSAEKRVALVIGNSNYKNVASLVNPRRDAEAIAAALRRIGFQVVMAHTDLGRAEFNEAIRAFGKAAVGADWAMVYYSGHGLQIGDQNYLIPTDASLASDKDVQYEAIPLEHVLAVTGARKLRLVVLDASRDNPFLQKMTRSQMVRCGGRTVGGCGGGALPVSDQDGGTIVVYAAKLGQVALDGGGTNSPFAASLLRWMQTPGLELSNVFRRVRDDVLRETGNQQEPYFYGVVPGDDFFFVSNK